MIKHNISYKQITDSNSSLITNLSKIDHDGENVYRDVGRMFSSHVNAGYDVNNLT